MSFWRLVCCWGAIDLIRGWLSWQPRKFRTDGADTVCIDAQVIGVYHTTCDRTALILEASHATQLDQDDQERIARYRCVKSQPRLISSVGQCAFQVPTMPGRHLQKC
jgi:hypothetical protein